jgi:hypothetical protein
MPDDTKGVSLGNVAARLFWMLFGPGIAAILALNIAIKGGGWMTGMNAAYLIVLALVPTARWLEFRSGQGQTAEGEPLTASVLHRYLLLAALTGLAVWIGANLIGNAGFGS